MTRATYTTQTVAAAILAALSIGAAPAGSTASAGDPRLVDGVVEMTVPVPVMLIGFPKESVRELRKQLAPMRVHHAAMDWNQTLPLEPERGAASHVPLTSDLYDLPIAPTAMFDVRAADPRLAADFGEAVRRAGVEHVPRGVTGGRRIFEEGPEPALFDGRKVEAWLAEELPKRGFVLDPRTPALVVAHLDALGIGDHEWTYVLPNGRPASVHRRTFGERAPLHVLDPSTRTPTDCNRHSNFFVTPREVCAPQVERYEHRLAASGDDLEHVAQFVRDAVRFRHLQGSVYPISTASCHAVTLIFGYEAASLSEHTFIRDALERFDPAVLDRAFRRVTGAHDLFVDAKVLELPKDDPVLDAVSRGHFPASLELQRAWLHENWERYWVRHDGCEAYVAFVVQADAAYAPATFAGGLAAYDEGKGHRVALGFVDELGQLLMDPEVQRHVFRDPERTHLDAVNLLFAHEVGHLLGLRHPHDVFEAGCNFPPRNAVFEQVWSAMSYATFDRLIDFGAVDHANWVRNRAGFMMRAALVEGHKGTPEWDEALKHLSNYRWREAGDALAPLINADGSRPGYAPTDTGEDFECPDGEE